MATDTYARTDFALEGLQLKDNRILVREDQPGIDMVGEGGITFRAEQLPSGLIAPAVAAGPGHYRLATVIAVGPGFRKTTTDERLKLYAQHKSGCSWWWCKQCGVDKRSHDGRTNSTCFAGHFVANVCDDECGLDKILRGDHDPLDVRPGDRVMMGRSYSGDPVVLDGVIHIVCREDDVVGRLVPGRMNQPFVDLDLGLTIQPLADRVLVEMVPQELTVSVTQSPRGVVFAQNVDVQFVLGTVVAHGDGWGLPNGKREVMTVVDGDTVLFRGDTGTPTRIGGKTFFMMRENEIAGIVDLTARM